MGDKSDQLNFLIGLILGICGIGLIGGICGMGGKGGICGIGNMGDGESFAPFANPTQWPSKSRMTPFSIQPQ